MLAVLVGALLALAVGIMATASGLDRDRAFYPAVTITVALYYVLFAAMAESTRALALESLAAVVFIALAIIGFRSSSWIVALALAGHGLFDSVHGRIIANPGVPVWWPPFCLTFDVAAAAYLAWLIVRRRG